MRARAVLAVLGFSSLFLSDVTAKERTIQSQLFHGDRVSVRSVDRVLGIRVVRMGSVQLELEPCVVGAGWIDRIKVSHASDQSREDNLLSACVDLQFHLLNYIAVRKDRGTGHQRILVFGLDTFIPVLVLPHVTPNCFLNFCIRGGQNKPSGKANVHGRRSTMVFKPEPNSDTSFSDFESQLTFQSGLYRNPWTMVSDQSVSGYLDRTAGKQEGPDKGSRSKYRKYQLRPCRYYLPFGGCRASLGGLGGQFLGIQILGLMLVGLLFAIPGVLGLFWVFDDPNRERKRLGVALAVCCLPATVFFYGWGLFGHPLGALGLSG